MSAAKRSLFLSFFLLPVLAFANITLPAIINNNMVLQQQSRVSLWGWANSNSEVVINTSWNNKVYKVKSSADGSWEILVRTPSAGGPFEISFSDGKEVTVSNILIGEVWICSGQSNMVMPVKGYLNQPVLNATSLLMDADNNKIRLFQVEEKMSLTPRNDCKGKWDISNAKSVKEFSAVGYQFAKILQEKLNVPIGMIQAAYGGSTIQAWMDKNSLKEFNVRLPDSEDSSEIERSSPTVLYNGMINPLIGYGIKGMLWYQGENNWKNPEGYGNLMAAMVNRFRELWNRGDWPFYYVQIAPYSYPSHRKKYPILGKNRPWLWIKLCGRLLSC